MRSTRSPTNERSEKKRQQSFGKAGRVGTDATDYANATVDTYQSPRGKATYDITGPVHWG